MDRWLWPKVLALALMVVRLSLVRKHKLTHCETIAKALCL
jgi:hypothetical protein